MFDKIYVIVYYDESGNSGCEPEAVASFSDEGEANLHCNYHNANWRKEVDLDITIDPYFVLAVPLPEESE